MINEGGLPLGPARVVRGGVCSAEIATDNGSRFPECGDGPGYIFVGKQAWFPIGAGYFRSQTIHVDRNIDPRIR